jgi:EAL domain-containing protein (putative c-di-GMP-specific phosphodiesterase class I)
MFDGGSDHPIELVRRAEEACAAAKGAGRNTLRVYDSSMSRREGSGDEALWVRRMRAGLDEGLLHLTTQWIEPADAHVREGSVFEVSLALEDEEGFWAEPSTFLPIAERNGMVAEIERWALRQTLEHLARSPAIVERLAFCCLPLSPQTVSEGATLELLAQLFQSHPDLPPARLCFVLRENVMNETPAAAQTFCDAMRSLGCRVALDPFMARGVGGVELLRRLPAEFLRIDARHFVDVSGDAVDQSIADAQIRLARTLQRRVIVTDVADEASREAWRRMRVDYVHGIAIARPSPVVFTANT